jgi:dipeptidyl aminopeptidase/acylaminoacyl peptidase
MVLLLLAALALAAHFALIAIVAELCIHPLPLRRPCETDALALQVAASHNASAEQVQIRSHDGLLLWAWWIQPANPGKHAVLVAHGVVDTGFGVLALAQMFLRNGYSVLVPDHRGHGRSKGFVTYGLKEAEDMVRWSSWIRDHGFEQVFGFGESLGGSALLLSLQSGCHFDAIACECAFASFQLAALDRARLIFGFLAGAPGRRIGAMIVWELLTYVRLRYGLRFDLTTPESAIQCATVPILLIHGEADCETLPYHATLLQKSYGTAGIWTVPGAVHTGALAQASEEFEERVLKHFQTCWK